MILALIKLMRLYYSLPLAAGFIVILAYLTGGDLGSISDKVALSFLALVFMISGGYVLNDICDKKVDIINCPTRMLAAGKIEIKAALAWAIILFTGGIAFGFFCGFWFFIFITIISGLLIFYDLFSKRMGIFKNVLVAILMTTLYPLALTLAEPVQTLRVNVFFIHPIWIFLSSLGYQMLKDIRDIEGDRIINNQRYYCNDKWFLVVSRLLIILGSLITVVPFLFGYCEKIYLTASVGAIVLATVSASKKPAIAIRYIYAEVFLITFGSMADLMVFGH